MESVTKSQSNSIKTLVIILRVAAVNSVSARNFSRFSWRDHQPQQIRHDQDKKIFLWKADNHLHGNNCRYPPDHGALKGFCSQAMKVNDSMNKKLNKLIMFGIKKCNLLLSSC